MASAAQDADLYILDDVMASVDAHVGAWLLEHAICGPLLQGKTCIACTHSPALAARADRVLNLLGGRIASDTSPSADELPLSKPSSSKASLSM